MVHGTDKIDIHLQTTLSPTQCDAAIGIWRKMDVFKTESNISKVIRARFDEVQVIWKRTFTNYDEDKDCDYNKCKRFTTQIINRYKDTIDFAGVGRVDYRKGNDSWCVICKPEKSFAIRKYNYGIGTSATNFVNSDKTNTAFELGRRSVGDLFQKIDVLIPNLIERASFYEEVGQLKEEKIESIRGLILLTGADQNGGVITRIGHEEPPEENNEDDSDEKTL